MIELTLKLYLQNKKFINGSTEDMQVGISNLINMNVSDTVITSIAKSLPSHARRDFIRLYAESENWNTRDEGLDRISTLNNGCKPWSQVFQDIDKESISNVEKEIVEYEITNLYLVQLSDKNFVKKINLELAW